MSRKTYIDGPDGSMLCGVYNAPRDTVFTELDKTLILMLHDFPGHKSDKNDLYGDIEFLLGNHGFHTLRFDLNGCGESDGQQEEFTLSKALDDVEHVLKWAREDRKYERFVVIGEGLGATLGIMAMQEDIYNLVLLWPALDLKAFQKNAFGLKDSPEITEKKNYISKDENRIGKPFLRELFDLDIVEYLESVKTPTLIMYGAQDEIIEHFQLDMIRKHIGARRVEITTFQDGGYGLEKLNHRKSMFYHIQQFIQKYN